MQPQLLVPVNSPHNILKAQELQGICTWYFQLSSKLCHMQGSEWPCMVLIGKKQKTKKPPHLETSEALLSNRAHFRCLSFQKAVLGPLTVNMFENRRDDTEQAHVTAVNTSANYCSKACQGRSTKCWTGSSKRNEVIADRSLTRCD